MLREIDNYFFLQKEPTKSCMLSLRRHILALDERITEVWRYKMPFYCFEGKRFCYLWVHKKFKQPYLGIVDGKLIDHNDLLSEKRSRMKILLLDPEKDLPLRKIDRILKTLLKYY